MHSTESRVITGPSNILFACVSVCTFQPGKFTSWGSQGVKREQALLATLRFLRMVKSSSLPFLCPLFHLPPFPWLDRESRPAVSPGDHPESKPHPANSSLKGNKYGPQPDFGERLYGLENDSSTR